MSDGFGLECEFRKGSASIGMFSICNLSVSAQYALKVWSAGLYGTIKQAIIV